MSGETRQTLRPARARRPYRRPAISVQASLSGQLTQPVQHRHKKAQHGERRQHREERIHPHVKRWRAIDIRQQRLEFLDLLVDLVPPPRKHRHRYHGVFAPNHKLRPAVTALAIGNVAKRGDAAAGGYAVGGHAARGDTNGDCCDSCDLTRSHDTSRIAWAKLMARVGEEVPLECPGCGGDIRRRGDGRQEPAHLEPEVRKREKARMASPA